MDPRGFAGSIYKGEYYTLVHTIYESSGPYGFGEEDFFYVFPMKPPGRARMDPRGTVVRIYSRIYYEDHYILLQTKYESSGPCGFGDLLKFFPSSHDAPGAGPVWTPGARLAGFIKRTTIHCYKQNLKALGLVVSEKKIFLCFTHSPHPAQGGALMDPRGRVGRIYYNEDHYTLLHTKYDFFSFGSCGFREEDF